MQEDPSEEARSGRAFDRPWIIRLALTGVIIGAASLSAYWVFLVPIFESPDEVVHFDYALNLYSAGRLISAREPFHAWNTPIPPLNPNPKTSVVHVYTSYLIDASDLKTIRFNPTKRVVSDYGTSAFYNDLDRNAPDERSGDMDGKPRNIFSFVTVYPYGYYSAVAAWMGVLGHFSHRLSVLYFGARLFSVSLLIASLLLTYAICVELRFSAWRAVLVTAIIGFFPLTSFVSSYVQPDNLAFTLVMLCCYLALLIKRKADWRLLLLLGLSLGALCVTKYQYYACVLIAVMGMLAACRLSGSLKNVSWKSLFALTLLPSLLFASVQVWINYGSQMEPLIANRDPLQGFKEASTGVMGFTGFVLNGIASAFGNFFIGGPMFDSFLGTFGWMDTPLVIVSPGFDYFIRSIVRIIVLITLVLLLVRVKQIAPRLIVAVRRGHWRSALRVSFGNPLLNSFWLFAAFLFGFAVLAGDYYAGQGRYWFPFMLPIFLIGTHYAPLAVANHKIRGTLSNSLTAMLALYCVVGSCFAIRSLLARFYEH